MKMKLNESKIRSAIDWVLSIDSRLVNSHLVWEESDSRDASSEPMICRGMLFECPSPTPTGTTDLSTPSQLQAELLVLNELLDRD